MISDWKWHYSFAFHSMVFYCPACGAEKVTETKFCPECGKRMLREEPAAAREETKEHFAENDGEVGYSEEQCGREK